MRFFGADFVVLAGGEVEEKMRLYQEFSRNEILAALPEPQRTRRAATPAPVFAIGPHLVESEQVAVVFDEVEGLNFYAGFGLVEAVFADPALLRSPTHKMRLTDYLDDDSVSPLPFRRLAERDPSQASLLFQKLLPPTRLRLAARPRRPPPRAQAAPLRRPAIPSLCPISDRLAPYASPRPG